MVGRYVGWAWRIGGWARGERRGEEMKRETKERKKGGSWVLNVMLLEVILMCLEVLMIFEVGPD
jgi:hypothetical protein